MPKEYHAEVPLSRAALRLGLTRERVCRMIQTRRLAGALKDGRWVVFEDSLRGYEQQHVSQAAA